MSRDKHEVHTERPELDVPVEDFEHIDADAWTIAAGLPQLASVLHDGTRAADASPEDWRRQLSPAKSEGFTQIELPSTWIPLTEISQDRQNELFSTIADMGFTVPGLSLARSSILQAGREKQNLRAHHKTIDIAAERRIPFVCIGLHEPLLPRQKEALWFWDAQGPTQPSDPDTYDAAVAGFRELARHASDVGVELTLEMYEDTYLGSADGAVRLLEDIDSDAIGLNPDVGNLLRLNRPVDTWEYMLYRMLPHTNYWHVKNYTRSALVGSGQFATAPAPLALGIINYRKALAFAFAHGFHGPFITEHYGGDGIHISGLNREYLRDLMRAYSGALL